VTPVWAWLRLDLRRRWRSLAVLTLLVALACGTVMAATAGARRGGSAVDRLYDATLAATATVSPMTPGFDWDRVRKLPGVEAVGTIVLGDVPLNLERIEASGNSHTEDEDHYWFSFGDTDMGRTVERPAVLAGRLADPARVDEAMVTALFAENVHLRVGDTVTARLFTPEQADAFYLDNARNAPTGPRQPLRIVGIVRSPVVNTNLHHSVFMTTVAFTDAYRANLVGGGGHGDDYGVVRLTDGEAGLPDFQRRLAELTGRDDIGVVSLAEHARDTKKMTGFERDALLVFALAALVASAVVLTQAAARHAAASATDLQVLRTLGMTAGQATASAAAGPALASVVGVLVAAAVAVAASGLFPFGTAADYEPDPGVDVDLAVLGGTSALVMVIVAAAAAFGARQAFAGQRSAATPRASVIASAAYKLGLPVPVVFGTRFALEPGRGRAAVPVRPALLGAVVGVLGVLAALTFHAGVADAADNPQRFGQTYQIGGWAGYNGKDFTPFEPIREAFTADPDVVAVNDTRVGEATANATPVEIFSHDPGGDGRPLPVVTLSGRMPAAPFEIALAPETARETGAEAGDTLTFAGTAQAPMRVTGVAFTPGSGGGSGYAKGAWVTAEGYRALFPNGSFSYHQIYVALRPGVDAGAVRQRVWAALSGEGSTAEFGVVDLPREAEQLHNVRMLPLALGVFLALLAVAATGHALATAVRRRRHDVAVLRALGITRRQSRLIVLTQAITLSAVGLAFGVPLGVALGRTVWRVVAEFTPVLYIPPVAPLALALAVPVALGVGILLAATPARRAARIRIGDTLRAE
jgi:hypothetical protein